MNRIRKISFVSVLIALTTSLTISLSVAGCKEKEQQSAEYAKALADIAASYNKSCPKQQVNGTTLQSVTYKDSIMTFRLIVTDEAIVTINLDSARNSIINSMSDNLKKHLVKANSNVEYRYVSTNDSSSITIVPAELGYKDEEEK